MRRKNFSCFFRAVKRSLCSSATFSSSFVIVAVLCKYQPTSVLTWFILYVKSSASSADYKQRGTKHSQKWEPLSPIIIVVTLQILCWILCDRPTWFKMSIKTKRWLFQVPQTQVPKDYFFLKSLKSDISNFVVPGLTGSLTDQHIIRKCTGKTAETTMVAAGWTQSTQR